jgi:hypothetical protein
MTVGELKEILKDVPDDFHFEVWQTVLEQSDWGYDITRHQVEKGDYDIGWSDRKMHIGISQSKIQ